jgi:NADH-quinone oxidoreductase subunit C
MGPKGKGMDRETIEHTLKSIEPHICRREKVDRPAVEVPVERLLGLMRQLREDKRLAFDMLLDHTAIDRPKEERFELVYNLYSTKHGHALMVICSVSRTNPVVPTMERIWQGAHWQEREVFDLFGVLYDEHMDLRRLFLEEDWKGYPLRKDYKDDDMLEFDE